MQWTGFQWAASATNHAQATRVLTRRAAATDMSVFDDQACDRKYTIVRVLLVLLANVMGGAFLLFGMFLLPQVLANIFV